MLSRAAMTTRTPLLKASGGRMMSSAQGAATAGVGVDGATAAQSTKWKMCGSGGRAAFGRMLLARSVLGGVFWGSLFYFGATVLRRLDAIEASNGALAAKYEVLPRVKEATPSLTGPTNA